MTTMIYKDTIHSRLFLQCLFTLCMYVCRISCEFSHDFGSFYIRHYFGKCLEYNDTRRVFTFASICREKFRWSSGARLFHIPSGKCAGVNSTDEGAYLVLSHRCTSTSTLFQYDEADRVLFHLVSGRCLHPENTSSSPESLTAVVLKAGCTKNANQFYFRQHAYYVIRHSGGFCFSRSSGSLMKLANYATCQRFYFENNYILKHVRTGYCLSLSKDRIDLPNRCVSPQPIFAQMKNSTIHLNATHCLQPKSGRINPPHYDTILQAACTEEKYKKFDFLDERDVLRVKLVSESCDDIPIGTPCDQARGFVTVNGFQYSLNTRGINVVLFDYRSGLYEHSSTYDVLLNPIRMADLTKFLNNLSPGKILFMASKGAVSFDVSTATALQRFGVSARFATTKLPKFHVSMATVALTGPERKDWERSVHNVDATGALTLEINIYSFRDANGKDDCTNEIGVQTRRFPNSRFFAESSWKDRSDHGPSRARLHHKMAGWCSKENAPVSEFLQIDLGTVKILTGIAIQANGKHGYHHVTKFKLQYSVDMVTWSYYVNKENIPNVFDGLRQHGKIETRVNWFRRTMVRLLRIVPTARESDAGITCLRVELFGCSTERPIFRNEVAHYDEDVCFNKSLSIHYSVPSPSIVTFGLSASADNESLATSIDSQITSMSGYYLCDNGNAGVESTSMFTSKNNETNMDRAGFLQFKILNPSDYTFNISIASKIFGPDITDNSFWSIMSFDTAERITIVCMPKQFQPHPRDHSILQLNFTDFGPAEFVNGQLIQLNFSLGHRVIYGECRRRPSAYDVDLFLYYDSTFIDFQSIAFHEINHYSPPSLSSSTRQGLLYVHMDKFDYYNNLNFVVGLTIKAPKGFLKGSRCTGSFVVDFRYLTNLLQLNGTLKYTTGKVLTYKYRISHWKDNAIKSDQLNTYQFSMVINNLNNGFFFCIRKVLDLTKFLPMCYRQEVDSSTWHGISYLVAVLGVDAKTDILYGLNQDQIHVQSSFPFAEVFQVENSEWVKVQRKTSFHKAFVIHDVSLLPLKPESRSSLTTASGREMWSATRSGIFKKSGGIWHLKVSF